MDLRGAARRFLDRARTNPEPYVLDLSVAALCLVALIKGLATVWDLSWPCDVDLYRDIGFAQSILDGRFFADPLYLEEKSWYNPLVPSLIALVSAITSLPAHLAATRMGPFINLLAPVGFYIMASCFFGRRTGLASTLAYLFISPGGFPSWASATYSPWLFPSNFVQGLFFLGLAAYWRASRAYRPRWNMATGALLGVVFLGHTAPALILGCVVVLGSLHTLVETWREDPGSPRRHGAVLSLATILATALVVSLPYAWPIVFHYGLNVLNNEPASWLWDKIVIFGVASFVGQNISLLSLLPALGLLAVALNPPRYTERRLLLYWLAIAGALFAYTYVWQLLKVVGVQVPRVVPGHHFLIYLKALEVLLLGRGLVLVSKYVLSLARYLAPPLDRAISANGERARRVDRGLLYLVLAATLAAAWPAYVDREDFNMERFKAKKISPQPGALQAYYWMLKSTEPTDVFLADDHHTLHLISAAGRKVVSTVAYFSNPFCDFKGRHKDRSRLFAAMQGGDVPTFKRLAHKRRLRYVLLDPSQKIHPAFSNVLRMAFDRGGIRIYRLP